MGLVGLFGIIVCLFAMPSASRGSKNNRALIFFMLLAAHLASSYLYYLYVQTEPADTNLYFYDRAGYAEDPFRFGTTFTVQLVQFLKHYFGGSYLDYFLLFQSFGFWGVIILMRVFQEIHLDLRITPTRMSYALLFLPGVHFWTSAIGKDAPLFFAVSLAVWSAMHLRKRILTFALAIVVMVCFRPHIALMALIALAVAAFFDARSSAVTKVGLLGFAVVALALVAGTVRSALAVDVTSTESVDAFFDRYNAATEQVVGSTNAMDASYLARLFGLLFRPLFFDADGAFALVASLENVVYLFVIGFLVTHLGGTIRIARAVFFLRFALVFATVFLLLLASIWYNVGLGLRQKMMATPAIFALFVAHWAIYTAQLGERRARALRMRGAAIPSAASP